MSRRRAGGLNTYGVAQYKMMPRVSLAEVEALTRAGWIFAAVCASAKTSRWPS